MMFNNKSRRECSVAEETDNLAIVVHSSLDDSDEGKRQPRPSSFLMTVACFSIILMLTTTTVYIAMVLMTRETSMFSSLCPPARAPRPMQRPNASRHCGKTTVSARAAGCVYDIMVVGWTSPECFDATLSLEAFRNSSSTASGSFVFSTSPHLDDPSTHVPPERDALVAHDQLYAPAAFHIAHCAYSWRLVTRALERRAKGEHPVWLYADLFTSSHSVHCRDMLLQWRDLDARTRTAVQPKGVHQCVAL